MVLMNNSTFTTKGSVTGADVKCLCTNQYLLRRGGGMGRMYGVYEQINLYYKGNCKWGGCLESVQIRFYYEGEGEWGG